MSPREHTRAWRDWTQLRQMMIEEVCVIDISRGINAAPVWIRQYQA